ncbi:bifunctional folylpolyglutamate synthase/dihydrofolate synthase [Spiroplasma endosymbiont of Aleiodes alternator]|uniref:bifunctional folylpolyglutamate synthase/dihydrofolate synthase n=1 Tax=Spiroplasma endosymbiont of Aleiodes alternator TaxID=3139329 RepID=UPI003CCADF3F
MNEEFFKKISKYSNKDCLKKLKIISPKYLNNNIKYIHVTGTNGKGSVSRLIFAILSQTLKQKIGLFTSPHIEFVNERIIVNDRMISNQDLVRIRDLIFDDIEYYQLGFFGILTLIALIYFQEQNVQWAIIEVGIGGKIDPTNIIDATYAIITSIGKDHQDRLGKTISEILHQKLGIVKPMTKNIFISGNLNNKLKKQIDMEGYKPIYSPRLINQPYYQENKKLVLTVISKTFLEINIKQALKIINDTNIRLRFEKYQINYKTIYFDAAHNIDGIKALIKTLKINKIIPQQIIFSCLKNKYPQKLISCLKKVSDNIIICSNSNLNSITGEFFDYQKMIECSPHKIILITGSSYFLADVYNFLRTKKIIMIKKGGN